MAWRRWDFAERIQQVSDRLDEDPLARYALGLYLRLARGQRASGRAITAGPSSVGGPAQTEEENAR
jgi:hypothetical protein